MTKTFVCIASGPSLTQEDCVLVASYGYPIIAVNRSWEICTSAQYLIAHDAEFWVEHGKAISTTARRWTTNRDVAELLRINWLQTKLNGSVNSGQCAIELAAHLGATRILLLGYDCSIKNGRHWHSDHHGKNPDKDSVKSWVKQFTAIKKHLPGIEIINCSRYTELPTFAVQPLEDALKGIGKSSLPLPQAEEVKPSAKVKMPDYQWRDRTKPWFIHGMHGVGDNINQRPFIKSLVQEGIDVYLETPLPELYADIAGLKFVDPKSKLRTQAKNAKRSSIKFVKPPTVREEFTIGHDNETKKYYNVCETFHQQFQCKPQRADLPKFKGSSLLNGKNHIAVIRPTTVRKEWFNSARGPLNEYIDIIARDLAERGYTCVSVADCVEGVEWVDGAEPFAHIKLHSGELTITELMALIDDAEIVVSGDYLLFHAAVAYKTPMLCVLGGWGHASHPMMISDPRIQDLRKTHFVWPDNFCMCQDMQHDCDKTITNLMSQVTPFLDGLRKPVPMGGVVPSRPIVSVDTETHRVAPPV